LKYEWRKQDKKLYIPKTNPEIITLKPYKYIKVTGEGNPNSENFQKGVETLYGLSYGLKMAPRNKVTIEGYYDYTVFPLEGRWNLTKEGIKKYNQGIPITELKDFFSYEIMIRQPEFITNEIFDLIKERVFTKKKNTILEAELYTSEEMLICQALHIGSYDNEPATFRLMEEFCENESYKRKSKSHIEIYIGDPRKTDIEKLKTTLRFEIINK